MEIENKIRLRIEAILGADARSRAEMARAACADEPFEADPFGEERNLYQGIINSYRSAIGEVNGLLEENVGYLSSFCRIVEAIKDKVDIQAICAYMVQAMLEDLRAEYCSIVFFRSDTHNQDSFHIEGVHEGCKFFRIHSNPGLLGSLEFEDALAQRILETGECLNVSDVNREPLFSHVDFPSVMRSLLAIPIAAGNVPIGCLILSHSLPSCFNENHIRMLRILSGMLALITLHTNPPVQNEAQTAFETVARPEDAPVPREYSLVLLDFLIATGPGRTVRPDKRCLLAIRNCLGEALRDRGTIFLQDEGELLALLPAVSCETLPEIVGRMQKAFQEWSARQAESPQKIRMNVGFATCDGEEELSRMLELASLAMHPEPDEESRAAANSN